MTTALAGLPETPADVAASALDGIEGNLDAFDMCNWIWVRGQRPVNVLSPDVEPRCGTTLCAAGWVCHVTGWTLVDQDARVTITSRPTDGNERQDLIDCFAVKQGERRLIAEVARDALGLQDHETFWSVTEEEALERLREIAGRGL